MEAVLDTIWSRSGAELWGYALILARVLPIALLAPWLGGRFVPVIARVGVGLVLAAVLLPAVPVASAPADPVEAAEAVVAELLLGAALGFLAALVVYAAVMAGAMVDAARGQRDPLLGDLLGAGAAGPTATLLALGTIAIFFAADGHHAVLSALRASFEEVPAGAVAPSVAALEASLLGLVGLMGEMVSLAVAVSLPVLLAVLLAALALGLAGRLAPRLHSFFLALPLQSLLGLFVLVVGLGVALEVLVGELAGSGGWIRTFVEALGGGG